MSPLYKKGNQSDPANYRPLSIISHVRKAIDATILTYVCEKFTTVLLQFGFQPCTLVQQVILQAQANTQRGPALAVVLDLVNAYDKVDLRKLIQKMSETFDESCLNMVRATLEPVRARTKGDRTDYTAVITIGVPQGSPS